MIQNILRILSIVVIVASVVLLITGVLAFSSKSPVSRDLIQNWSLKPISSIYASKSVGCAPDDALIDRSWPGTSHGCYCPGLIYSSLWTGTCTWNETRDGCRQVSSTPPIWLSTYKGVEICATWMDMDFTNIVWPSKQLGAGVGCPSGMKVCGTGQVSDQICVSTSENCPINKIVHLSQDQIAEADQQCLILADQSKLCYSGSGSSLPIIRTELAEEHVCLDKSYHMRTEGRSAAYTLLNDNGYWSCPSVVDDVKYDERYVQIDTITEDLLYKQNGVSAVIATLPKYPSETGTFTWTLFAGTYIQWSLDCENSGFRRQDFLELVKGADKADRFSTTILVFSIINFILVVTESILLFLLALNKIDRSKCKKTYMLVFQVFILIMLFLNAVFALIRYFSIQAHSGEISQLLDSRCSDDVTNRGLMYYAQNILSSSSKLLALMVITVL